MARTTRTDTHSTNDAQTEEARSSVDENHGHGGSYVNTPEGTRVLVERTEQRIPRSAEEEERAAREKADK